MLVNVIIIMVSCHCTNNQSKSSVYLNHCDFTNPVISSDVKIMLLCHIPYSTEYTLVPK